MCGCLVTLIALVAPRAALAVVWLTTDWFSRAYQTVFWPLVGWVFMPYTTAAYMAAMLNNHGTVNGWWLALVVVAVLVDLGTYGSGSHAGGRWAVTRRGR